MHSVRVISRLLILIAVSAFTLTGQAQWNTSKNTIDTSDYIPPYLRDYIEYNLMIAASKGYSSEIIRMVEMGADINASTYEGATPLIFAVSNNMTDAVRTILSYEPEIDKVTASGETAFMIAVKSQFFEIAEMLIRAGADINFTDSQGASALHYSALYGYLDIADLLIYYQAAIDLRTVEGTTPLLTSVWAGFIDITDLLLQNGSDPDARNNEGFTPFLLSSYFGDTLMMDLLRGKGADIYARNNNGYNALSLAIISEHLEAVEYLIKTGKNWTGQGTDSPDPYTVAAKYGRKDIIEKLRKNNIPGNVKYGIDQVSFDLSGRITSHDFITGASLGFREPLLNAGIVAGIDFKPWYSRVLVKESDINFIQYMDKGSLAYAGIFKDLILYEEPNQFRFVFSGSLLGGYAFGNNLKGTYRSPGNKIKLIPSAGFQLQHGQFRISADMEYIKTEFHKIGPLWFRLGLGYNYYFDNTRTKIKPPKWF